MITASETKNMLNNSLIRASRGDSRDRRQRRRSSSRRGSFSKYTFQTKLYSALDYNQDLLNLMKDGNKKDFEDAFTNTAKKKQEINREHVFDSKRTFIKVGNLNKRFPFDTQEPIFELYQAHPRSLTAQGLKIKDVDVQQEKCNCC